MNRVFCTKLLTNGAHCQFISNVSSLFRRTTSAHFVDHSGNRHVNIICELVNWNFELSVNRN